MKNKLLIIGLMSLFVDNAYASDLRDVIAKNPVVFAALGYALGTIGYKLCTVDPIRALSFRINQKNSRKGISALQNGSDEFASCEINKQNTYARGYDFLGVSVFESKHDFLVHISDQDKNLEQIKINKKTAELSKILENFNTKYFPQASTSRSLILDEATNHKVAIVADHKTIFAGIATGAVFGGLALWATKK